MLVSVVSGSAGGAVCLRGDEAQCAVDALDGSPHEQRAAVEIQVCPQGAEQLTTPESRAERQDEDRLEPIADHDVQQVPRLVRSEGAAFRTPDRGRPYRLGDIAGHQIRPLGVGPARSAAHRGP
jgi:hypothetical protein